MKDFLSNAIIGGILLILLGIFLLVNPNGAWEVILRIIGVILIIMGIVQAVTYKKQKGTPEESKLYLVAAVILGALGLILLIWPQLFVRLLPIIFGIAIGYGAVLTFIRNSNKKKMGIHVSPASYVLAILSLVLAVFICINPTFIANIFVQVAGAALIIAGITMFSSAGSGGNSRRAA